jgi:2-dehydro-3-deoxygalactonokinase
MYFVMDMGTTNTRLWLYNGETEVACVKGAFGARSGKLQGREFLYGKLRELIFGVLNENGVSERDVECIMVSGMAGSEGGICDVPHISLPAGEMKLASSVVRKAVSEITSVPFIFVPGLKKVENELKTDVMRGEETETAGIYNAMGLKDGAVLVLPGTHNKVIRVNAAGEIVDFCTTMSGEIADIVIKNSILAGSVAHDFDLVEEQLFAGARYAEENGFNAAVFHVRVMGMNGLGCDELSSFLYGAVFGQDVALIKRFAGDKMVYVGGKESLQRIYCSLLGDCARTLPRGASDNAVRDQLIRIYGMI